MAINKTLTAELSMLDGSVNISGVLNFETVPTLMKQAEQLFKNQDKISVDLINVTDSNSAGLALLLEMVRTTKLQSKSINFKNLPEQICIVANAYGIDCEREAFLNSQFNS
ncbi:MAG: STAS domain-containing protein [Gammaproteobacteria bacterium]|nr:STAS domain-containing protein [Gammaproteobacteria bacterium]